jgi:hypothetical protein
MTPHEIDNVLCGTVKDGAQLGLLGLMAGISQDHYAAGWMNGLEYDLWLIEPGKEYGWREITERQSTLLRLLSDECDGWWYFDMHHGPIFISLDKWRDMLKLRSK